MLLHEGRAVDDVVAFIQCREQQSDLADRVLQVVVHRNDYVTPCRSNTAQQRIMLPIVAVQSDAMNTGVDPRQFGDNPPRPVPPTILDEDDLEVRS